MYGNVDDTLRLTWRSDNGEHEGYIPLQWLKQNSDSEEALEEKRRGAKPQMAPKVHRFNHTSIVSSSS